MTADSVRQNRRLAEHWCAVGLYPGLPPREAVDPLTDSTLIAPATPLPGLPPTREQQQQTRRLAEATATATARVREALEPARPPATKPRPKDARKAWVRAGLRDLRGR